MEHARNLIPAFKAIIEAERIRASEVHTVGTPPGHRGYSLLLGAHSECLFLAVFGVDLALNSSGGDSSRGSRDPILVYSLP